MVNHFPARRSNISLNSVNKRAGPPMGSQQFRMSPGPTSRSPIATMPFRFRAATTLPPQQTVSQTLINSRALRSRISRERRRCGLVHTTQFMLSQFQVDQVQPRRCQPQLCLARYMPCCAQELHCQTAQRYGPGPVLKYRRLARGDLFRSGIWIAMMFDLCMQ
jgi:hypothetical protein